MSVQVAELTSTSDSPTRPRAGTWQIDPLHSTIGFLARHMMVAKVRGHFADFSGTVEIAANPADSKVDVSMRVNSITTNVDARDNHLRSADFFDSETFPDLIFKSTSIEVLSDTEGRVTGDLTIRDVTRPVVLDVLYEGEGKDPWGGSHAGFSATAEIDREDFGITYNMAIEAGGVMIGKKIRLELDVELLDEVAVANAAAQAS